MVTFAVLTAKEKPPMSVVGDVGGRIAIIVVGASNGSTCFLLTPRAVFILLLSG